jgi:IS30 family transposase
MQNKYKHLSSEERDKIAVLRARGCSYGSIARAIDRDKTTVFRELNRNRSPVYNVYLSHMADGRAKRRKSASGTRRRLKNRIIRRYVIAKLKLGWSPEQISGTISKKRPGCSISYEAIYQYIYDKETRKRVNLAQYLPRAHKKRKLFGQGYRHKSKVRIPRRVSIDKRPKLVAKRAQAGHWEADTVISRQSKRALAVSIERKSRMMHIDKLQAKKSRRLVKAITTRLKRYPQGLRRTITYDNGSENVEHERINKILGTKSYFCNPFHSWEKGSIEHAIGLVRRFLPKKTDFAIIDNRQLRKIENRINNRPRKCLNYQTPREVMKSLSVALAG